VRRKNLTGRRWSAHPRARADLVLLLSTLGFGLGVEPALASASSNGQSGHAATWAGVGELVVAKLTTTGEKSGTPYQHTELTVSGNKPITVKVPMSGSGMRLLAGSKPPVHNGVATFDVTPNGTTTENVRSDFTAALPLKVKVAYKLNGKAINPSSLAPTRHLGRKVYKSGTLTVSYTISNVSKDTTTVSFEGFNGAQINQNVTDPQPMVAEVKVTFPKGATGINAPKANLAAGHSGVHATWDLALAPPLSAGSQTVTYTDHLSKVKAPVATIEAEAVVPASAPTGKVPAGAASALASAEGAVEPELGDPSTSLGGVHSDLNRPARSASTSLPANKKNKKASNSNSLSPISNIEQKFDALVSDQTSSLAAIQQNLDTLATTQTASQQAMSATTTGQIAGLGTVALQAITNLAAQLGPTSTSSTSVVATLVSQLSTSAANLAWSLRTHLSHQSNHTAAVDAINATLSALVGTISALAQAIAQHVSDTSALDILLAKLITDANAFPPSERSTPEWIQLSADLTAAKAKADVVSSAAASLQQTVSTITSTVQNLQSSVAALDADAHNLEGEAANAAGDLSTALTTAEGNVDATLQSVSAKIAAFDAQVAAEQSNVGNAEAGAQSSIASAEQKASTAVTSAKATAQSSAQQALGKAQTGLYSANSDYAQLLALVQIALLHQLPNGNATGANVQSGAYVLRVAATS
jgi:hypothetical protein